MNCWRANDGYAWYLFGGASAPRQKASLLVRLQLSAPYAATVCKRTEWTGTRENPQTRKIAPDRGYTPAGATRGNGGYFKSNRMCIKQEVSPTSKPRYAWWSYVKSMVRRYPDKVTREEAAAVSEAIQKTECLADGADRMKVIQMALIKNTHTLQGAALSVPCDYETAKRWQQQFIKHVARAFSCDGLLKD